MLQLLKKHKAPYRHCFAAVIIVASTASDLVEAVLDGIAAVIFGTLAVIAAAVAAIFSLFGF